MTPEQTKMWEILADDPPESEVIYRKKIIEDLDQRIHDKLNEIAKLESVLLKLEDRFQQSINLRYD